MTTILIAGGTGLVGTRLSELLAQQQYRVIHLSRTEKKQARFPAYRWDTKTAYVDPEALQQADYIINLAGAGIADSHWTAARKKELIESRTQTTNLLYNACQQQNTWPKAYLASSAVGYYGNRKDELLTEESKLGTGFLAECCDLWEQAGASFQQSPTRLVVLRIGLVLSTQDGALPKLLLPLKAGLSSYFGDGQQWYPWIHIDDLCNMFIHALHTESIKGVYNAVAPNPVRNIDFARQLGEATQKSPLIVPAPAFALRLGMGEMADVVLNSTRCSSQKIEATGFAFQFSDLVPALRDVIKESK